MYHLELFELSSSRPSRLQVKAGSHIRVKTGLLWLTVQGRAEDVWLRAGEQWCAPQDLTVWISAEVCAGASGVQGELVHPAQPLTWARGWGRSVQGASTGILRRILAGRQAAYFMVTV